MALIALVATAIRWPLSLYAIVPATACYVAWKLGAFKATNEFVPIAVAAGCMYVPYLVGFVSDCRHCAFEVWPKLFPIAPGLVPAMLTLHLIGVGRMPEWIELTLGGATAFGMLLILWHVGRRGPRWLIAISMVTVGGSTVFAFMLRAAVRA
jgi:hypothetical protein